MTRQGTEAVRDELVRILGLMVEDRDAVSVTASTEGRQVRFTLRVGTDELGKVIGRQGRTAQALRCLLDARGEHDGRRYALDIRGD